MSKAKTIAKLAKKGAMPAQPANARSVAYSVLSSLEEKDSYANLLLPRVLGQVDLSDQDKNFVTDIVYGTLRWRLFLDTVIEAAHKKPLRTINAKLINVVRLGAYQWLFMNIAEYACVNETVNLARKRVGKQTSGFVNALMRKIVAYDRRQWEVNVTSRIRKSGDMNDDDVYIARAAVRYSHPEWIVRELRDAWNASGYQGSENLAHEDKRENERDSKRDYVHEMLAADNEAPAVTLCVRPGLAQIDDVYDDVEENQRGTAVRGELSPYALRVRSVNPQKLQGIIDGTVGVEDEGSQLAALMLALAPASTDAAQNGHTQDGHAQNEQFGHEQWLDMCAGPGGKTALLAALATQHGAKLSANEPHDHRRELVKDNVRAIPSSTIGEITGIDGREFGSAYPEHFDRILVDAPCSGLGALCRRPEARWRKTPESVVELAQLQKSLLLSAVDALKFGGVVAYVTCSPVLAETREIVDAVVDLRDDIYRLDVPTIMHELNPNIPVPEESSHDDVLKEPRDMQLFEHIHDTDQMFIALLKKK